LASERHGRGLASFARRRAARGCGGGGSAVSAGRGGGATWDDLPTEKLTAADGAVAEVVAQVALNILTDYFNHIAGTPLDFPRAAALTPGAAKVWS
jgi:hypothetical protein